MTLKEKLRQNLTGHLSNDKTEVDVNIAATIADNYAIEFAEWLQENRWYSFTQGKWNYTFEQGTSISEATYNKNYRKTSQELLEIFKKEKGL